MNDAEPSNIQPRGGRRAILAAGLASAATFIGSRRASATTYAEAKQITVTTWAEFVTAVGSSCSYDHILIKGTLTPTSTELSPAAVNRDGLTVEGIGRSRIDTPNGTWAIRVNANRVTLKGLTINAGPRSAGFVRGGGIYVSQGLYNVTIADCVISGAGADSGGSEGWKKSPVFVEQGCLRISVINNRILQTMTHDAIRFCAAPNYESTDILILGNYVDTVTLDPTGSPPSVGSCLRLAHCRDVVVSGNHFLYAALWGIRCDDSERVNCTQNILNSCYAGIAMINTDDSLISANQIIDANEETPSEGIGIELLGAALVCSDNVISKLDGLSEGISVKGDVSSGMKTIAMVSGNIIKGANWGVFVHAHATQCCIRTNEIWTAWGGIALYADGGEIDQMVVKGNVIHGSTVAPVGIYVHGATKTVVHENIQYVPAAAADNFIGVAYGASAYVDYSGNLSPTNWLPSSSHGNNRRVLTP